MVLHLPTRVNVNFCPHAKRILGTSFEADFEEILQTLPLLVVEIQASEFVSIVGNQVQVAVVVEVGVGCAAGHGVALKTPFLYFVGKS